MRFARYSLLLFFIFLAAGFAGTARADGGLALDKVVFEFAADERPIENVMVSNQSDVPLRVTVRGVEVFNSGQPSEREEPAENLVVAPKSFELESGAQRAVRIILKKRPEDMEKVFRVRFMPDKPTQTQNQQVGDKNIRVGVIMAMGVLAMAPPKNIKPDLKFARAGNIMKFTNAGNVTAQLQREEFCSEDKTVCASLQGKRIYPGMSWDMEIPEKLVGKSFSQTVLINGNYSTLTYPVN